MSDWISHLQHGYKAQSENHSTIAYTHFHAAWEENPEHPLVCFAWGQALAQTGHTRDAVVLLERAARAEPDLIEIACAWAKAVLDLGDFASAERILVELETKHPQDHLVRLTLVELAVRRGDPDAAERHLATAEEHGAERRTLRIARAQIAQVRGLLASRAGQHEPACRHFEAAIEFEPAWAGPWINLGVLAEGASDVPRALACYAQALQIDPGHPVALYNAARLHARAGDTRAARDLVTRLLDAVPEYPGGRELADSMKSRDADSMKSRDADSMKSPS
jgi:Flp pilus assembly protein TadD